MTTVARRHGVDAEHVKEVAGGVANRAFILGDDLFLRASRPGYEDDLRKETHVVPAARLVGVLTPEILEYDETHRLLAAPYVVMERIHGAEPTEAPTGLAEELARLHQLERTPADAPTPQDLRTEARPGDRRGDGGESRPRRALDLPGVPEDDWGDPWRTVDDLATRGYVDPATASWLTGWFTRLAERFDDSGPKVLIHGDVAAHNLLAGPGNELRALIDWGDAAWAPRAMEFAKLPLTQVAKILPTYAAQSPDTEEDLAAAILWFHLSWALAKLPAPPWPNQRHWTAPTTSRLLNLLHFFTTTPPPPWPGLA
ncbi:aminoglycoside phosphotransferase (APT) family kinase protein [Kribbella rubisoli]|uniref:Aminoglycoside phosphotransferase (APT) family kinase protein n=1 Tax=Kribbella rubisoli TaxID=3075929 RepID=A0A4Q7WUN6_9ACTN|nr:aminoglycoside phosphotransferase family protein [Kribbella rubisoli]RZU14071.1 aminoglycoside phosphotransferase (APT) family kinase protein [Kribbella rubisoli]